MALETLVRDSFDGVSYPTSINGRTWDNVGGGSLSGITHTGLSTQIKGEYSIDSRVDNTSAQGSIISNSFNYANAGVSNSGDGIGFQANAELWAGNSWFRLHPRWVDASNRIIVDFSVGSAPKVTATVGGSQVHSAFITDFSNVGNSNVLYEAYVVDTVTGVTVTVTVGAETYSVDIADTGLQVGNIGTAANTLAQWNSGRQNFTWVYDLAIIQLAGGGGAVVGVGPVRILGRAYKGLGKVIGIGRKWMRKAFDKTPHHRYTGNTPTGEQYARPTQTERPRYYYRVSNGAVHRNLRSRR